MALAETTVSSNQVFVGTEILFNADYTARALTLDAAAFTDGVCLAGNPIAADGTVANTADAIGVLLTDVDVDYPHAAVVIGGYINTAVAEEHSGVTIADAAAAAMKNVVFC